VARALAAGEVDLTVNNPIEAAKLWADGRGRPLRVLDSVKFPYNTRIAGDKSWADLPTCLSFGIPVQYQMMRSIFTTPGATPSQVAYYSDVLDKVRALPEWQNFMAQGAFRPSTMKGAPLVTWLERSAIFHRTLMRESKFIYTVPLVTAPVSDPKK
jgi:tripartite-type tricarboxylate transporter receptor subunit TctC